MAHVLGVVRVGCRANDMVSFGAKLATTIGAPYEKPSHVREKVGAFIHGNGPTEWAAFAYRTCHRAEGTGVRGPAPLRFESRQGALSFSSGRWLASVLFGLELVNLEYERLIGEAVARETPGREDAARAALASRESLERIAHCLSSVVGRRVEVRFPLGRQSPQIFFDGAEVPLELLGDGLRGTFSWVADLIVRLRHTPWKDTSRSPFDQEFWLLLDDVDQGLHPQLQARLYPALREAFPYARIYGTTHSPFVVASLGEGVVFPIRPDPRTRRVTGQVVARLLRPGSSLAVVVEEVFAAPSDFVDAGTCEALQRHREVVDRLRRGEAIDVDGFARDRLFLLGLNEDVAVVVAMREAPARRQVDAALARLEATG